VFQNLLLEGSEGVLRASERLWGSLLATAPPSALPAALPDASVRGWAALAATPPGATLDVRYILQVDAVAAQEGGAAPKSKRARLKVRALNLMKKLIHP
jgi:hypothetical protein